MIGEKTFSQLACMTEELITEHASRITKAFSQQDDGKLNVTITLTIAPGKTMEQYDLDAKISYVSERVSEKITAKVTENQGELPLKGDARTK